MGRAAAMATTGMILMASAALGQTVAPPPEEVVVASPVATSGETVLVPGIAEIQFSPRFWYLFESYGQPNRRISPNSFATNNGDEFALGGASVSARFNFLPETIFVLTGLYGTNGPAPAQNESFTESPPSVLQNTNNTNRIDIELLAISKIPNHDWAWIAGGRFERHDDTFTNTLFLPNSPPSNFKTTGSVSLYSGKAGLLAGVPLTADANLRLFGNIMAVVGVGSESAGPNFGFVGPDASIGLQYTFSPTISADMRYRVFVYFPFSAPPGTPSYVVYQGPMIGVNFKF
jgi:hypothetical protein